MASQRLGKILENFFSRAGMDHKIQEQRIIEAWALMVGSTIATMTGAVRVRNRVLQVKVTNSVWMHELQFHKKLIIQKLNEHLGIPAVQDLWFFIGEKEAEKEAPPLGGKKNRERQSRDLSEEEKGRIKKEISHLDDPEMREILWRVFSRALSCEKGIERIVK